MLFVTFCKSHSAQESVVRFSNTLQFLFRLSGLSPFMGESDVDTFSNITCADFDFDDDSFDAVSQDAKDFISSLLVHRKEKRLTAMQCLESKWLSDRNAKLSTARICTDKLKKFVIRRKWQVGKLQSLKVKLALSFRFSFFLFCFLN